MEDAVLANAIFEFATDLFPVHRYAANLRILLAWT